MSTSYAYARSSNALSSPSLTLSRIAVYKPPRSSPLAGPAISVDIDDGEDDNDESGGSDGVVITETEREKARSSSRLPSPYPTPPRTPSPTGHCFRVEVQNATDTPEIAVKTNEFVSRTVLRSQKSPKQQPSFSANPTARIDVDHQNGLSTQRSSHVYVRTPFSAPPIMSGSHPTYDINAITTRAGQRPRSAPGLSSSSSSSSSSLVSTSLCPSALPGERGAFSAPSSIRSAAARKRDTMPYMQSLGSNDGCKMSLSSSSNRHACPNTSPNPMLNWITASNHAPPPFSRTRLRSVVMPIKASEAEARKTTRRLKTSPNLRTSSIFALPDLQAPEINKSQPVPNVYVLKEERRCICQHPSGPSPPFLPSSGNDTHGGRTFENSETRAERLGNEKELHFCDDEGEKDTNPAMRLDMKECRTEAGTAGKWKWKQLFIKKKGL